MQANQKGNPSHFFFFFTSITHSHLFGMMRPWSEFLPNFPKPAPQVALTCPAVLRPHPATLPLPQPVRPFGFPLSCELLFDPPFSEDLRSDHLSYGVLVSFAVGHLMRTNVAVAIASHQNSIGKLASHNQAEAFLTNVRLRRSGIPFISGLYG